MKIIGIDPGYDRLGIAIIEKNNQKKELLLYSDCFKTSNKESIHERLYKIGTEISKILDRFHPNIMALETLFITKNQKTAMWVAEVRGIIAYEAMKRKMFVTEYSPKQIKLAVTGSGSSDKKQVDKMIHLLIEIAKKQALDDEIDAIAVAITAGTIIHNTRSL